MKNHKMVIRFLIYLFLLYIGWFFLYDYYLSFIDHWLTQKIADGSVLLLNLIGYAATSAEATVSIDGRELVHIGPPCNGMVLMAFFSGFIMAFPGSMISKAFFIPLGIIVINILNLLRVTALTLNSLYSAQSVEFNHKYTFTIFVYAAIFAMWIYWVKKYSSLKNYEPTTAYPEHTQA